MVCFGLCVASALWVLIPHNLLVALRGEELLERGNRQGTHDVARAYRAAGRWIEPRLELNRIEIARLSYFLAVSCVLLAAEAVLWTISLIG
jgi:hypothetical protein